LRGVFFNAAAGSAQRQSPRRLKPCMSMQETACSNFMRVIANYGAGLVD
jgi:hypothetical protein